MGFFRHKPPADSRQWEPGCERESEGSSALPAARLPSQPALCTALVSFALSHPQQSWVPAPRTHGHRSHGGPPSILVKEPIQVNSDSIFPPLLDKQNREMPLTRKPSSNHLVFAASHSGNNTTSSHMLSVPRLYYLLLIELKPAHCFFVILYKALSSANTLPE